MAKKSPFMDWQSVKAALGNAISNAFKPAWSYAPKRTTASYAETFHVSPRLDALDMMATDVADTGFHVYDKAEYKKDKTDAEPIEEHPLIKLLDNPMPGNIELDGFALRYATIVYWRLIGECFWVLERNLRGEPVEAYIVPPSWVIFTPTEPQPYYLIQPMGNTSHKPLSVAPEDVIWFKDVDLNSPYGRGRGRTESIGDELESDEYAAKWAKNFFYNDATPRTLISIPGATDEQAARFKESWVQKFGSWVKAHSPAVLNMKDVTVTKLSDTPKEMDFVESRKFLRDTANQHHALPPELMGILENSNRSTIDSAYYLWTKNVISKLVRRFASVLNRQLLPQFKDDTILVFDEVVPEDQATRWLQIKEAVGAGIATRNEARHALGLPPDEKAGDVYLMAFSVMERKVNEKVEVVKPEPPEPEKEKDKVEDELDDDEIDEGTEPAKSFEPQKKKSLSSEKKVAYWKSFDAKASSGEKMFIDAIGKYAGVKGKECQEAFKKYLKTGMAYDKAVEATIKKVYGAAADKMLRDGLLPAWMKSMKEGAALASELLGKPVSFDLLNPRFMKWVSDHGLDAATLINDTTKGALRDTIAQGIEVGESIPDLMKRLEKVDEDLSGYRAENIARTETTATVSRGSLDTYAGEGVEKIAWLASRDDRTREDHADADGQEVKIGEMFEVGGEQLECPGDSSHGASAGNICQCRCTILPLTELD